MGSSPSGWRSARTRSTTVPIVSMTACGVDGWGVFSRTRGVTSSAVARSTRAAFTPVPPTSMPRASPASGMASERSAEGAAAARAAGRDGVGLIGSRIRPVGPPGTGLSRTWRRGFAYDAPTMDAPTLHAPRMFDPYGDFKLLPPDPDPDETSDWIASLDALTEAVGRERAQFVLYKLLKRARQLHIGLPPLTQTRYINTISPEQEAAFPGDERMELRIRRMVRWNAAAMVLRANMSSPGIGGHLATFASATSLYEVGFNHFFRGKDAEGMGDQVFFQGHAAPGVYARAFLEGRLSADQLDHFRREVVPGQGLSSYPHPRLMPDFWEFPSVSMGLAPLAAIYQARFNRYLHHRGIKDTSHNRVWAFLGDGETDEPESLGSLSIAAREGLDNLVFVVNCNLQRLDGPVRGNGKIIQELEAVFRGAGWNVIKVIWGREWDSLLARDLDGVLVQRMADVLDGEWQKYSVEPGSYMREHFFGADPRLAALVADKTDEELKELRRGGHDYRKLYAAYHAATQQNGAPTAILAKTVKGWTLGSSVEARNITHQAKKMNELELRVFRDRLELPIPDEQLKDAPYYHPGAGRPRDPLPAGAPRRAGRARRRAASCSRRRWPRPGTRSSASSRRAPAARRSRRRWPSRSCCGTSCATRSSGRASCPSSPTRRAPSAWIRSSRRWASTRRWASSTTRSTRSSSSPTGRTAPARSSRRA